METSTRRGLPRAMVDDVFLAPVYINAGGTVYTTCLDTLTKYPESKLAKLFDGTLAISIDPINRQYFLDVNGSVFAHVLDFLRYGELLLPEDFTQLPLLTKLAECFEIRAMIQALINMGGEESSGTDEEGRNIDKQQKKTCRNRKHLGIVRLRSESHANQNNHLELEKMDNPVETGEMYIGTCELGIVKLGMLEGGKVEFGTKESATMMGEKIETEVLRAQNIETEKLSAGNIEPELIEAKSTKVELLKAEQLKLDTVEMDQVKAGNVEMQTVDVGLTKVEMLETIALKSKTADFEIVTAEDVKIKRLEAESLKLKSLDLETVSANFVNAVSSKCAITKSDGIDANGSNFIIVSVDFNGISVAATDRELDFRNINSKLQRHNGYPPDIRYDDSELFNYWISHGTNFKAPFGRHFHLCNPMVLSILVHCSKDGYKLHTAESSVENSSQCSRYILVK